MNNQENYFLQPGYIYAGHKQIMISTVLGSCVSICFWDRRNRFGGMNHFVYPRRRNNRTSTNYGDIACPYLFKMMKELGSEKNDLDVHVIGGASNDAFSSNVGEENIETAHEFLKKTGFNNAIWDVGGSFGRKVVFDTASGEVLIYKCSNIRGSDWYKKDKGDSSR